MGFVLNTATKPVDELTQVLFLGGKHLEDPVLVLFIAAEEGTDALLIGFAGHVRVEVADDLLALVDGIGATQEQSE
jgi:hypothetical protein